MNTLYSHAIRLLTCQGCGAPFDATIAGGRVRCRYCQAVNEVTRRDEELDRQRAREAMGAPISESERFARLRTQDQGPETLPPSVAAHVTDGRLRAEAVSDALRDWHAARQHLAAGSSAFSVAEQLFHLTGLLADRLDDRRQRAALETAAELLTDARHRHVVRCMLARRAAQHRDLDGARAWLDTCNPRPTDLVMDTAYRLAAATLATAERNAMRVHELLGYRDGDVPLADRQQAACDALRLHALELGGQRPAAVAEMRRWIQQRGADTVQRELGRFAPLRVARGAFEEAARAETAAEDERTLNELVARGRKKPTGLPAFVKPTLMSPVLALLLLVPVTAIRWAADADPLMGVYGLPLCPEVCGGCHGPARTVTVWTPAGGGEWTSNGADYYCSGPAAEIGDWSAARIEAERGQLFAQKLGAGAALGGTGLILYVLALAMVPLLGLRTHLRNAGSAREIEDRVRRTAARLGRPPPRSRSRVTWSQALVMIPSVHLAYLLGCGLLIGLSLL